MVVKTLNKKPTVSKTKAAPGRKSDRYNGNVNLPKANTVKEMNPEQRAEFLKCMADPVYFAEKYFKIIHVDRGVIPFELFDYQREAVQMFTQRRKMIMCASRQCGKTSAATVMILHTALFNEHKRIALLANKKDTATEILERVKLAYEYLPDFLKGGVVEWNKGNVKFENGCNIAADATDSASIRGKSVFLLYIDECAFIDNWDEFSASVLPTLSSGKETKMIFTSTPHGLNHFYYYCKNAEEKKSDFGYISVPWTRVPGRDEKWKQEALGELNFDLARFDQEYNLEFQGSSGTLISGAALKALRPNEEPLTRNEDNTLLQYMMPVKDHLYMMAVDTSRGKGLDYSAFHVIDVTKAPFQQVCVYRSNILSSVDFSQIVYQIGRLYNEAHILIEINDLGQQVADLLFMDMEYENLIYTQNNGRSGKQVSMNAGASDRGIRTTKQTKGKGCALLKMLIEQNQLTIIDPETINELNVFSKKGVSYEAEQGKHDDLVMGLVLFAWLTDQMFFEEMTDSALSETLKEISDERMYGELLPFGVINTGLGDAFTQPDSYGFVTLEEDDFDRWFESD